MTLVTCSCGKKLKVKEELRGKRVRCPGCGQAMHLEASPAGSGEREGERPKKRKKRRKSARPHASGRQAIVGACVAGGCILLLIVVFGIWKYRVATSLETRIKQLASNDPKRVETAQKALEKAGKKALPQLIKGIKGTSEPIRTHCLALLNKLGPEAEPALDDFQRGIGDNNSSVRIACITAIGYLGEKGRPAEARLLELLADTDAEVRRAAFETLSAVSKLKAGTPPEDGRWVGTWRRGDDSYTITFTIAKGGTVIKDLRYETNFKTGTGSAGTTLGPAAESPVEKGNFCVKVRASRIVGRFTNSTEASGTAYIRFGLGQIASIGANGPRFKEIHHHSNDQSWMARKE